MKHNNILSIAIVATIVLAMIVGPASSGFAQVIYSSGRVVQGLFGPRVIGAPPVAPYQAITGGMALSPIQPFAIPGGGGTAFTSPSGFPFGAINPPGALYLPQASAMSPSAAAMYSSLAGGPPVTIGPGGAISPIQANWTSPWQTAQPSTGTTLAMPETPAGSMPIGQMPYLPGQNVPGQNVPNAPGQNVPNAPGQNVPNAPGQNAQPGAAPQGALPAQNAAGAVPAAGQSPGGAGPASTPGQTMPATGGTIPATSAALSVARAPAPWTLGFTPAPAGVVSASLTARLENAKQIQKRSRISVTMQRDTAVLGGRVATEHDRDLAAAMLMLEPGVAQVQNELVVESPPPAVQGVSAR